MADWHALRWDDADREFKQAISADSMSAVARTQYGRYLITAARIPEAITQLRVARTLDPLAGTSSVWLSYALDKAGDKNAAREESRRSRELDPNFLNNRTVLVLDIVHDGRFKEALAATGTGTFPPGFSGMAAYNLEMAGDKARAAQLRKSLDSLPDTTWAVHTSRAWSYIATGDTAKALAELEAAANRREIIAQMIPLVDKVYDPIRQSPRFAEIIRRLHLDGRGLTSPGGGRPAP
jgi:Tfp pilus assembly protein PilF